MAFNNIPPNGFPALPDVEDLEAVEKDVTTLKSSVSGLTEDVNDLNDNKANQITIAPFFNSETSYDVGDLVYYNGLSYRCTNAHEGEWDADDFAPTTIANELSSLMNGLAGKQNDLNLAYYAANLNLVPTGICVADTNSQNTPVAGHRFIVFTARCYIGEYGFSLQWAYDHDGSNKIYTRTEWASWSAWMVVSTT